MSNFYFYCGFSKMYETLHGMYDGGIEECSFAEAKLEAEECARSVVENYDCILSDIHSNVNEELGYDDTPEEPDDEYIDALEEAIEYEMEYVVYLVTEEGENHIDEMEMDVSNYPEYVENGWLIDPTN